MESTAESAAVWGSDSQKGHQDWWGFEKDCGENLSAYAAAPLVKLKQKKNNLNDIQHLNKSEAIQQSAPFPAGEWENLLSFKHRSVAPIFHGENT